MKRFSFIEMIIVMAIIAILAAMLLSALQAARENAERIQRAREIADKTRSGLYTKEDYTLNEMSINRLCTIVEITNRREHVTYIVMRSLEGNYCLLDVIKPKKIELEKDSP